MSVDNQVEGQPRAENRGGEANNRRRLDWIALAGALGAIVAAIYTGWSAHVASEQNIVAEQQQLLTLTVSIAQQFAQQQATVTTAEGGLTGTSRTAAKSNALVGITNLLSADGEAAQILIGKLRGNGVAGVEYVQTGKALVVGGDISQALAYFQQALTAPPGTADTKASALRNAGAALYSLGNLGAGHQDMMRAVAAFSGPDLTRSDVDNGIAQSYLYDAELQFENQGSCAIEESDIQAAQNSMSWLKSHDQATTGNLSMSASDALASARSC